MAKIDTSGWKEFKISDVFITEKKGASIQVPTGAMMAKKDLLDGSTPRVTVSNFNNGITGYYKDSDDKNYRVFENFISVSFLGTVFYQPDKVSLDMKVHCLKPIDYTLNMYSAGYIVSVLRNAISNFAYSDQLSSSVLANMAIMLPSTPFGAPDWAYMEDYMKGIENNILTRLTALETAKDTEKKKIDTSQWKEFRVGDLFDAYLSKDDIQPKNIVEGNTPLVSSGKENNGIIAYIHSEKASLWDAGAITVDMFGKAFYQPAPFYCVSHGRVNILVSKVKASEYALRFVSTCIEHITSQKYDFSEMCTGTKLLKEMIKLPSTSSGDPDWVYMENYMKGIENKVRASADALMR